MRFDIADDGRRHMTTIDTDMEVLATKVFKGLTLIADSGEEMVIFMRDDGFEFTYQGSEYSAQRGVIHRMSKVEAPLTVDPPEVITTPEVYIPEIVQADAWHDAKRDATNGI